MKINLSKGSFARVDESLKNGRCNVKLEWKSGIDLDLHAIVRSGSRTKRVYFGDKGSLDSFPFTKLDFDAGVGNRAGDNEENLTINKLSNVDEVLFFIDAYGKDQIKYSKYKPTLKIEFQGKEFHVDFSDEQSEGKYFVLARIVADKIHNVNRSTNRQPSLDIAYTASEGRPAATPEELGFVGSVLKKFKNIFGL